MYHRYCIALLIYLFASCGNNNAGREPVVFYDTAVTATPLDDSVAHTTIPDANVQAGPTDREAVVRFAETLVGVPYKYGSSDPRQGFDCSGFITYVFNHFNIQVPRSSVDFTNVGNQISLQAAKRGDLILFTGTDSLVRVVGHMGIITQNTDTLKFIHSSSGKVYGVTITPLNEYYRGRFVKVIDIF
jgi:cell wall-associated NlpC family hydrolase